MKNTNSVSLIVTVKNEADNILKLLKSITIQTFQPGEVVIVDGGSTDNTVAIMQTFIKDLSTQKSPSLQTKYRLFSKNMNRSQGRNLAIGQAKYELIAITDAGCILDKDWLKELVKTKQQTQSPVVAGYYQGWADSPFTQAVIPYFLVMPDKVNSQDFLPSTRSMLIEKSLWKTIGGFREDLDVSEDYEFSQRLKAYLQASSQPSSISSIAFANSALVTWFPPKNLVDFLVTVVNMAVGDAKASIIRIKVKLLFVRYLIIFGLLSLWLETAWPLLGVGLLSCILLYLIWSVYKNYRYTQKGWYWLPVLQVTSDIMIMGGTVLGWINRRAI